MSVAGIQMAPLRTTYRQGLTGRVFQLRVGSGLGIEKILRVGSGRVGYRVFVSNTKSIGYYWVDFLYFLISIILFD